MSDELPIVIEDNWEVYSYSTDDGPVLATFYAGADSIDRDQFPFCARVILPIRHPDDMGCPGEDESTRLYALEDELVAQLKRQSARCLQVARLTHDGLRELVFQVCDWESFRPPVADWIDQIEDYEIGVEEHEGWEFFDAMVWPSEEDWLMIHDRSVVENLIEAGSDPDKDHGIEMVFTGDADALAAVAEHLTARGYGLTSEDVEGRLVMVKQMPLDLMEISRESIENYRLADECGAEYDGWGAAVER